MINVKKYHNNSNYNMTYTYVNRNKVEKMKKIRKLCSFGEEVEQLRNTRGMTKAELCRRVQISQVYYDYIIHGKRTGYVQREKIRKILTNN